ncbi:MAG: hypothetical protein EPO21_10700 [Chloroflexota bacterium]|nr:MAG: hypothetical protein EPO21_10700 [Chloroflexota bacterium]
MRQKLIRELEDRLHLDHDTALRAADVAVRVVKERLPEQLRPYLSSSADGDERLEGHDGFLG